MRLPITTPSCLLGRETVQGNTLTTQEFGNLASLRPASGAVHDLGHRVSLTASRIKSMLTSTQPEPRFADAQEMPQPAPDSPHLTGSLPDRGPGKRSV